MKFAFLRNLLKSKDFFYVFSFLMSFFLTIIPFFIVQKNLCIVKIEILIVLFCFLIQIFLHFRNFLHFDLSYKNKWYFFSLIFVVGIMFITFLGSNWIMHNLFSSHLS